MSSDKPSPISSNSSQLSEGLNQEISQEEFIKLLKATITKLDFIVQQVNEENINNLPNKDTLNTLINSTEIIANSLENKSQIVNSPEIQEKEDKDIEESEDWEDDLTPTQVSNISEINEVTEDIEADQKPQIEASSSPPSFLKSLFGGKIAQIIGFVLIIALSVSFFVYKPSLPNLEIFNSSPEITQPQVVETPTELEEPSLPEPIQNVPSSPPKLTPEQSLIAGIQKEVTALTNQYPDDLIGKIEANFLGSRLIVTVGDKWYSLSTTEQNQLANTILEKTQSLDFRKLEMLDSQRNLIARSPVVGNEIIILKRNL
ncbi:hypothetical protein [Crocosphaera chwakensis]|uniref:Uncharacterized protein n=1 Tax=Crocosphaera chwakensis CCY0110 TaxID=391612 RepID=A3IKH7_9CHRO|nr:hypothetical protein [Crocosphaera chwakensis]EAZ93166.1 hypothetical protein CY0110_03819 [Crocosphaera chwakensis CCY0110]